MIARQHVVGGGPVRNSGEQLVLCDLIREFRIERRHIAALTWDAMFRSRRAAILAGEGGFLY